MSKVFRAIGQVAGVIALIPSPIQPIAAAVAAVATVAAQLTAKKPGAIGQINDRLIGANNPLPYMIGRTYSGGIQVHDAGYGGEVDDVKNPYRFIAVVHSCCGPIEEIEALQTDYTTVSFSGTAATGYYADYLWCDTQLGARPESTALTPEFAGCPEWGSDYKLSGFAAVGWSLKWSKKAKRFPGGQMPILGGIFKGVKVYDPRLDSTYPGGSGPQRLNDESTWAYSRSPALHSGTYAYGRYVNGVKVFGVDLGADGVDFASIVAWANVCDVNGWNADGTIYEPGDKWNNLKRISEAGGGEPLISGGKLTFDFQAPRTSLYTVTRDDLADGSISARLGKSWKDRHNTLVPKYRSEPHQWNYVQAGAISVPAWVTEDGEEKSDERQFDLVTDVDQAAQLALYDLYQRREGGPVRLTCKSHMRAYRPGQCLTLAAELGAHPDGAMKVVIRSRDIDPVGGTVTFECEQETDAKHAAALAAVGVAPPVVALPSTPDLDDAWYYNGLDPDAVTMDRTDLTFDSTLETMDAV